MTDINTIYSPPKPLVFHIERFRDVYNEDGEVEASETEHEYCFGKSWHIRTDRCDGAFRIELRCDEFLERSRVTYRIGDLKYSTWGSDHDAGFDEPGLPWPLGFKSFDVLCGLCDARGTLTISVAIQVAPNDVPEDEVFWKPKSDVLGKLRRLCDSKEGADVTFVVNGEKVMAHKTFILMNSTESHLYQLVQANDEKEIEIKDCNQPFLFKTMIDYLYSEQVPANFDWATNGVDLLKLADKYGLVNLKLHAEWLIVCKNAEHMHEWAPRLLLVADQHNCALLREKCVEIVAGNVGTYSKCAEWGLLLQSPSIAHDLLTRANNCDGMESLDSLRKRAEEQGLEVDGSREMLIKRLKKE